MRKKKKFHISLDEELKPDLAYYMTHIERQNKALANRIFGINDGEAEKDEFKFEELYRTRTQKPQTQPISEEHKSLLEKAEAEALALAAAIFNKF